MQFYTNSLIELPMLFNSISVIHVIKWNSINRFYHEFFFLKLNIIEISFFFIKSLLIYIFTAKGARRDGPTEGGDLPEAEEGSRGEKETSVP